MGGVLGLADLGRLHVGDREALIGLFSFGGLVGFKLRLGAIRGRRIPDVHLHIFLLEEGRVKTTAPSPRKPLA